MLIKECHFETVLIDSRYFRKGIFLTLTNQGGKKTTSEISPLPGFSSETVEEAMGDLQRFKQKLLTTWWTKHSLHNLKNFGLFPSVYFGVETALLNLLDPIEEKECQSYALLIGSPSEILHRADEAYEEGFRHAKIKLGHLTPPIAHNLIAYTSEKFRLRLDFNRKWPFKETMDFCSHYPVDLFEYIEEPTTNPKDLLEFSHPFALDESLREIRDLRPYLASPLLKAFIIKPTMQFPFSQYLSLGPKVILTSSFESPLAIRLIKQWIQRFNLGESYHGLDSLRYFEKNHDTVSNRILEAASR
jgi:o-succinylbenzoate synthase